MGRFGNLAAAVTAGLAALSLASEATAQSISPEPADPNWRGTLGMPFPGEVFDVEVLGHNRFVLIVNDGAADRAQVFTAMNGFQGEAFVASAFEARIHDVVASAGGYWVISTDGAAQPLSLRRFDDAGRSQGPAVVLEASTEAREARLFALAGGAILVAWTQHRPSYAPLPASPVSSPALEGLSEALFVQVVRPDGEASPAALIDETVIERQAIDQQGFITGLSLADGGAVVGWAERHSETWARSPRFVRFDAIGKPVGPSRPVEIGSRAESPRGISLVPRRGAPGFAAVVGAGFDLAVVRFDSDGSPESVLVMPHEDGSLSPLYAEGQDLVVTDGRYGPRGMQRLVGDERRPMDAYGNSTAAHVIEPSGNVVLALRVEGGGMKVSHLYRVVVE